MEDYPTRTNKFIKEKARLSKSAGKRAREFLKKSIKKSKSYGRLSACGAPRRGRRLFRFRRPSRMLSTEELGRRLARFGKIGKIELEAERSLSRAENGGEGLERVERDRGRCRVKLNRKNPGDFVILGSTKISRKRLFKVFDDHDVGVEEHLVDSGNVERPPKMVVDDDNSSTGSFVKRQTKRMMSHLQRAVAESRQGKF